MFISIRSTIPGPKILFPGSCKMTANVELFPLSKTKTRLHTTTQEKQHLWCSSPTTRWHFSNSFCYWLTFKTELVQHSCSSFIFHSYLNYCFSYICSTSHITFFEKKKHYSEYTLTPRFYNSYNVRFNYEDFIFTCYFFLLNNSLNNFTSVSKVCLNCCKTSICVWLPWQDATCKIQPVNYLLVFQQCQLSAVKSAREREYTTLSRAGKPHSLQNKGITF